jgi:CobQ-like glutamine amidotransferase family enzyme/UDP-N-acetylmuramyl tripeptide synthase
VTAPPGTEPAPPVRARAAAWATVALGGLSRRLKRGSGSVVGGRVGLAMEPDLLRRMGRGRTAALVTGTNGKTTTTRLLAAALGGTGRVATNAVGSNLPAGLAAALAAAPGRPAVLEVDEGYLGPVTEMLAPQVVVLLNLSRDQLDRVSEVRMVASRFRHALDRFDGTVVANADDPLVVWAAGTAPHVRWVGAGQLWRSDAVGCPACDGPVLFDPSGTGWASGCGLRRPAPALWLEGTEVVGADGWRRPLVLSLPGRFNRANAVMALAAAELVGVEPAAALSAMEGVGDVEGRFAVASCGGVQARLMLAKNPAGWTELLELLDGGDEAVVVGINARVADGRDPSWLWDVAFERLARRRVVATGERARDLAVRLRYAGVAHVVVPDQLDALGASGDPRVQYVGNYTAFQDLRRRLARLPAIDPPGAQASAPAVRSFPAAMAVPAARPPAETELLTEPARRRRLSDGVSAVRVVVVHPDLLGTYGDAGNAMVLAARAAWRGASVELVLAWSGLALPAGGDVYCLGGGEDGPELQAAERLTASPLRRAVGQGAVVLGVCAGYQLLGTSFPDASGASRPGLGLLDVTTAKGSGRRAVGEIVAEPLAAAPVPAAAVLTGFENHSGHTRRGPAVAALATVRRGIGNGDGTEGAWSENVFGTYLHGPVLARNPALADVILARATGETPLPLDDDEERALRAERLAAVGSPLWRRVLAHGRCRRPLPAVRPRR